jgi:hypothetical protein
VLEEVARLALDVGRTIWLWAGRGWTRGLIGIWIEDGHGGIVTLEWVVKVDCGQTRGGTHNIEMKTFDDGASPDGVGDDDGEPTGRCWVVVQSWNTKWWQRL